MGEGRGYYGKDDLGNLRVDDQPAGGGRTGMFVGPGAAVALSFFEMSDIFFWGDARDPQNHGVAAIGLFLLQYNSKKMKIF
jgi:hypothetical protein